MKKKKEKVEEIFKVEKKGKTKVIKKEGTYQEPVIRKNQIKQENKILKITLIIIAIIALILIGFWIGQRHKTFEYQGLKWDVIKAGHITFYHTYFYVTPTHKHNVYLRNDPRKLEKEVPFIGDLRVAGIVVMHGIDDFKCNGYGIASQASMEQVLNAWGIRVTTDPNATCDKQGRYTYIEFVAGNQTKIVQTGKSCYKIYVKDCEIFKAKERFLVEGFIAKNS